MLFQIKFPAVAAFAAMASAAEPLPSPLFHASFDGDSPVAAESRGEAAPVEAKGLEWTDGVSGSALHLTRTSGGTLAYAEAGNLNHACGTVSLWFRSDERAAASMSEATVGVGPMFYLLSNDFGTDRIGSGALVFRWHKHVLRGDVSDDADSYVQDARREAFDGNWHHVAWTWNANSMRLYVDGNPCGTSRDYYSPMRAASRAPYVFSHPVAFDRFFVGNRNGEEQCDGDIDELRIYGEALDSAQIASLAAEFSPVATCPPKPLPDYRVLFARPGRNPYVADAASVPGEIPQEDLELVGEVQLDSPEAIERLRAAERLRSAGDIAFGEAEGTRYAELGAKAGSRIAVRFADPGSASALYVFDLDYPDDKRRTMDVIVQCAERSANDYTMQCGVAAGGEYPATGRILTHRCVWWRKPGDIALVLMTARDGAPAAASAVRLWRVKSGRLPPAVEPPHRIRSQTERRHIALYYEDPAIGYDFSVPGEISTPEALGETIDRAVATMRFAGEDVLAYPGAWYQGLIGDHYNPRNHAVDFLSGWYEKFDAEGDLGLFPTLNIHNMPVPPELVTPETMTNGALHASPIAIHDTGLPNPGRWHGTPPNFNVAHPEVQSYILGIVDALAAQGAGHPSFRGVCLHVTRHTLLSWGGAESGYNDDCVGAFAKSAGVKAACDRDAPLRGKAYAEWLRSDPALWERWLDWRCGVVTEFWAEIARHLREARPDLMLWVNCGTTSYIQQDYATAPDFVRRANREAGIDAARLQAAIPNLIFSQCVIPADYRWRGQNLAPALREMQRTLCDRPETYSLLREVENPWVVQHDRYWESAIGRAGAAGGAPTLSCDWLQECIWRVSTINPSGANALRAFVLPLRFDDVLGMAKGGFLVGTYGMEPHLARFARAFRALPAVRMEEFFRDGAVVARMAEADGRLCGYIVNTDAAEASVEVHGLPAGATDLVTGRPLASRLRLAPYEMVSFAANGKGI